MWTICGTVEGIEIVLWLNVELILITEGSKGNFNYLSCIFVISRRHHGQFVHVRLKIKLYSRKVSNFYYCFWAV